MQGLGRGAWGVGRGAWGVGISNFEFSTHPPDMRDACPTRDKRFWLVLGCGRPGRPCRRDACTTRTTGTLTGYRGGPRNGGPNCARHTNFFQHRRRTTISLECHLSLLPLGKSRWAKPNVAFRGRDACPTKGKGIWPVLWCGRPGCTCRRDACTTRRSADLKDFATRRASSTVDTPQ